MKIRLSTVAVVIGLLLIFGPWLFGFEPSGLWYFGYLIATVLLAIAGYGAQLRQLGKGDPGEEIFRDALEKSKRYLTRIWKKVKE